jgi:glutathione S-transferase
VITLCGFSVSNYYNKVKMALLEKGIPFTEERVMTKSRDEAVLACSPLAKIPFIRTEQGALCESQVIVDYLDALSPQNPLTPADPWQAAKVRELVTFIELHLELVARELYGQAFFGGTVDEATQARVRQLLTKHIPGFKRLAKFSPYVAGEQLTQADCSAFVNLPLVAMATKAVSGPAHSVWRRTARPTANAWRPKRRSPDQPGCGWAAANATRALTSLR